MTSNILRSVDSVRSVVLETLKKQPSIVQDFPSDDDLERHLSDLESFKEQLIAQRARFSDLHGRLLTATSGDLAIQTQIDTACQQDSVHLMEIDTVVAKYTATISRLSRKRSYSVSSNEVRNGNGNGNGHSDGPPVKLPKLQLVTFDGSDVLKWTEFWDSFNVSIHKNGTLSDVDKMNYLKAQLKGTAKSAIDGLSSTAANYALAIQTLERQFGNKRLIIQGHYSALSLLPSAQNGNGALRETFNKIEQHINSLIALGENVKNSQMASLIKDKLPVGVIIRLEEQYGADLWDVDKLRDNIHRYLSIRESAEHGRSSSVKTDYATKPKKPRLEEKSESPLRGTASALFSGSTVKKRCIFCKEVSSHWATECKRYSTAEERIKQIPNRCFNCLVTGHNIKACRREKPCFYCKAVKKHHSSLCPVEFPSKKTATTAVAALTEEVNVPDRRTTSISLLGPGEAALLQTASTKLQSMDGKFSADIRLILDSGSHRTYITKEMMKKLHLITKRWEHLNLFTFGDEKSKYVEMEVVDVQVKLLDGSYATLEAHVIPTITGAYIREPFDFSPYQALYGALPLADSIPTTRETVQPDLLIGVEDYWILVTNEKIALTTGLYLIGTKFGWVLTGRFKSSTNLVSPAVACSATLSLCALGMTVLSLDD